MPSKRILILSTILVLYLCKKGYSYQNQDYDSTQKELKKQFVASKDTLVKKQTAQKLLQLARQHNDQENVLNSFLYYGLLSPDYAVKYGDSIILATKDAPTSIFPAQGYFMKGQGYFDQRKIKESLDQFLIAQKLSRTYDNKYILYSSNHMIAVLKNRIGQHKESLRIHRQNLQLVQSSISKKNQPSYLLSTYHGLGFLYKNIHQLDSAEYFNNKALEIAKTHNISKRKHILLNKGVIHFLKKQYPISEKAITEAVQLFKTSNDLPNLAESYFYLGKIQLARGQTKKAIALLKKTDSIFELTQDLLPELREGYEILIDHYKRKKDFEQQLVYLEQLLRLDSTLTSNKTYISKELKSKYDIPTLLLEKEFVIQKLREDKQGFKMAIIFVICFSIIGFVWVYFRQKKFKQRFQKVITQPSQVQKPDVSNLPSVTKKMEVPLEIAENILAQLKKFESKTGFTDNKISLSILAKKCDTNPTYLSKTINHYYNKKFTNYINDLRLEHAIDRLKNEASFRKYTINAIALESGFRSAETFSKLFKKKTGIYPSYFLKQLKQNT